MTQPKARHVPVLFQEVMDFIRVQPGCTYVDCTLGLAGHAEGIVRQLGSAGHFIGFARDPEALELARTRLSKVSEELGTEAPQVSLIGEAFSTIMPKPLFTVADVSRFRVRAEIDERDLGSVHLGQKVAIHAEGFPDSPMTGEVTWLAATMGRKTALSTIPAEKTDRDIREALIDFDPGDRTLVVGLRVTVEFLK